MTVALVTGASGGIGRATALALARRGTAVGLGYFRSEDAASALAREIEAIPGRAMLLRGDVTAAGDVRRIVDELAAALGPPDVLVCAAGVVRDTLLGASETGDFEEVLRVNLLGAVNACREVARHMVSRRRGAIVNVSSVAAQRPGRGQSNYAASKGGVESFTRALAVELAPRGIRVNAVAPGIIETKMSEEIRSLAPEEVSRRILLRRLGTAGEVANVIAFLCGDEASYVTGQVWSVDGGFKLE